MGATPYNHTTHKLAHLADEEILTVAVVAAKFFNNHHDALYAS